MMMKLKQNAYDAVVSVVEKQMHTGECIKVLTEEFNEIPRDTLGSIFSQCYQVKGLGMRAMPTIYRYMVSMASEGSDDQKKSLILDMAKEISFSPSLLARILLEQFALSLTPSMSVSSMVSQWMKTPGKIPDSRMKEQVKTCILNDTNYGPLAENMKHSVGYEYEFLLQENLDELKIPYLDEKALRMRGYDKTPDFKLEVPVAIGDRVVNWIESKASFGDRQNHSRYLEEQYWSYQNRFGSGLVIYWFGFIQELDIHDKEGIMLSDHFPTNMTTLHMVI